MKNEPATVYFICGKMAAGKSFRAIELAHTKDAVLLVQDTWLETTADEGFVVVRHERA